MKRYKQYKNLNCCFLSLRLCANVSPCQHVSTVHQQNRWLQNGEWLHITWCNLWHFYYKLKFRYFSGVRHPLLYRWLFHIYKVTAAAMDSAHLVLSVLWTLFIIKLAVMNVDIKQYLHYAKHFQAIRKWLCSCFCSFGLPLGLIWFFFICAPLFSFS